MTMVSLNTQQRSLAWNALPCICRLHQKLGDTYYIHFDNIIFSALPAKKQLSSAQKASLARACEKARQSNLAKSQAKVDQEKEFAKFQQASKPESPNKHNTTDDSMTEAEESPSPSPVKKKKMTKRLVKKKRKHYTSSDSDTSEDEPSDARHHAADHAALAKAAYEQNMARYKTDVVYKSLFPYLNGPTYKLIY